VPLENSAVFAATATIIEDAFGGHGRARRSRATGRPKRQKPQPAVALSQ
jgi:hypothetical protein